MKRKPYDGCCEQCAFFDLSAQSRFEPNPEMTGRCLAQLPQLEPMTRNGTGMWPFVERDEWCAKGQYREDIPPVGRVLWNLVEALRKIAAEKDLTDNQFRGRVNDVIDAVDNDEMINLLKTATEGDGNASDQVPGREDR